MPLLFAARRFCARRNPFRRRPLSAPAVNILIADILRRLKHMDPSADAQAIIDQVNKLPSAINAQVASEVSTAEAAKDAPARCGHLGDRYRGQQRQQRHRRSDSRDGPHAAGRSLSPPAPPLRSAGAVSSSPVL